MEYRACFGLDCQLFYLHRDPRVCINPAVTSPIYPLLICHLSNVRKQLSVPIAFTAIALFNMWVFGPHIRGPGPPDSRDLLGLKCLST